MFSKQQAVKRSTFLQSSNIYFRLLLFERSNGVKMALFMTFLLISCLAFGFTALGILYLRWYFNYWQKRGVPGPRPQLLVGNFPKTTMGQCNMLEELHEIYLEYKTKHKFAGVFAARTPKLLICDPQLALQILTQNFKNFHDNESSQWSSARVEQMRFCSPFVSIGEDWKARRSELVPALTVNKIRSFYTAMRDSAQKACDFLTAVGQQPLDGKELANRFTAQFMSNFIWGIEGNAFTVPQKAAATATLSPVHRMARDMILQSADCVRYYSSTAAWPWLRLLRPVRFFPITADRFFQQLLTDALNVRAQQTAEGGSMRGDMIDHLQQLREKKALNGVQIAGHTTTVLIDGYETGAILIAHCLLLLARNPRVQQKLREELLATDIADSLDALNELPYLEQCLQETLRIFPPLPTLFKICTEPSTLTKSNGSTLTLQPGDGIYISTYSFHRDPDYFENPEEFWPERFAEELGGVRKYRDMGVFMPFGDGPRMCPGMKLGLSEAKVAVSELTRNFEISVGANTRNDNKIANDSFLLMIDGDIELEFKRIH
ncbi:probable cytochrome P450 28d1 [Ceratitis capitata]|uniref:probable cytochrome P450 28d1 n=1 Tax=Ceratitis capitata TaxID=7213 RepID=UPI000A0F674B|nr:probable cytochrome P450 28d1 [Ceratitis capitata]